MISTPLACQCVIFKAAKYIQTMAGNYGSAFWPEKNIAGRQQNITRQGKKSRLTFRKNLFKFRHIFDFGECAEGGPQRPPRL